MRSAFALAVTLCFSLSAIAQTKVCMGGNLDTLTSAERHTCENQVQMTREAASSAKVPQDWHFVVVCGEDGWKDYMAFSERGENELRVEAADTDFANKTTFLRGTRLSSADASVQVVADAVTKRMGNTGDIQIARR